ncbi:MAG: UDP-N-acetylmuramate--L-alanine ligase [Cytophagales bacterium]
MKFDNIHSVYFLGIGGIGMSALALWFKSAGKNVSGYDKTPTRITENLEQKGISVHFDENIDKIPDSVKKDTENSLVIITPAIPSDHREKLWFEEKGIKLRKRAEILGLISSAFPCIAVAGTHGKTSVSSMIAHLLKNSGRNVTAFVGGLMKNYQSNVILGNAQAETHWVVAEADEFDRSFLHLHPDLAIITSVEADHLDIYRKEDSLKESFREFASRIRGNGKLYVQSKFVNDFKDLKGISISDYNLENATIHAEDLFVSPDQFSFTYVDDKGKIENLELYIPGFHNVENALAAISVCKNFNLSDEEIRKGIASYKGVSRRFDLIVKSEQIIYIDDYAHHPTEISALLKSVRRIYPGKKITAIFQPHLYTRTRDFAKGFSESLSLADRVILLPIYPAREKPIEGVDSAMLLEDIHTDEKDVFTKEEAIKEVEKLNDGILLTVGAGDIDQLVPKIKTVLNG